VLTLALGIGAGPAIYSAIDHIEEGRHLLVIEERALAIRRSTDAMSRWLGNPQIEPKAAEHFFRARLSSTNLKATSTTLSFCSS
jgi:hypothetical protein